MEIWLTLVRQLVQNENPRSCFFAFAVYSGGQLKTGTWICLCTDTVSNDVSSLRIQLIQLLVETSGYESSVHCGREQGQKAGWRLAERPHGQRCLGRGELRAWVHRGRMGYPMDDMVGLLPGNPCACWSFPRLSWWTSNSMKPWPIKDQIKFPGEHPCSPTHFWMLVMPHGNFWSTNQPRNCPGSRVAISGGSAEILYHHYS